MRHEVSNANSTRLRALPYALHTFHSHDTFPNSPGTSAAKKATFAKPGTGLPYKSTGGPSGGNKREGLLSGVLAEKMLELKKGAQVMLVKNVDEMLVNGCVGQVVGFFRYRDVMRMTQGENDNKRPVAVRATGFVRRVKIGPDGGLISVAEKENVKNGEMSAKGKSPVSQKEEEAFPVVEFPTPEGGKEAVLVMREEFRVEDSEGKLLARRMQVCCCWRL